MAKTRYGTLDFRYYDLPQREPVLIFTGEGWRRIYGEDAPDLHFHNILEIGYCREGGGRMVFGHEDFDYGVGSITVIPRNVPHNTINEKNVYSRWDYLFVDDSIMLQRFFPNDVSLAENAEERINARCILTSAEESPKLAAAFQSMLDEKTQNQPYASELIDADILRILLLVARMNWDFTKTQDVEFIHRSQQVRNALEYMDIHYSEPVTIRDLANAANMSETHFRRIFHEAMNMAPHEYLNMIRIQKACTMLIRTEYPVEIIAEKCGFTTLSTFNRNFRYFTEESPLKWKKNNSVKGDGGNTMKVSAHPGWH